MTDRELMQWALDALEGYARNCRCEGGGAPCDAAEALRARLAQPYAAQAALVDQQTQGRMYVDPVTGDVGIRTVKPEQEPRVKWDASAPLVVQPHPAFQATPPQPDLAKVGKVGVWGHGENNAV